MAFLIATSKAPKVSRKKNDDSDDDEPVSRERRRIDQPPPHAQKIILRLSDSFPLSVAFKSEYLNIGLFMSPKGKPGDDDNDEDDDNEEEFTDDDEGDESD